jgi:integrase
MPVEDVTTEAIEQWLAGFGGSVRTRNKLLIQLHGILGRAKKLYRLPSNAAAEVEKFPQRQAGDIDVFSPEEVWALVRTAESEQDGAIYLTAAFTGLRMGELLALRWRDVDFPGQTVRVRASYYLGQLTTPKSGKVRAVPLAPEVATALAQLGQREDWVGDDDLVFAGLTGGYQDGSALRRRCKLALAEASLRPLRFHDLRPYLRDANDRPRRYPSGAGVDGPRRHPDDDEVPPLLASARGRTAHRQSVQDAVRGRERVSGRAMKALQMKKMSEDVPPRRPKMSLYAGAAKR